MDRKETKSKDEIIIIRCLSKKNISNNQKLKTSLSNIKLITYESIFSFLSIKENLTVISKLSRKIKNFILSRKIFQLLKHIKKENLFCSIDELLQLPNLIETNAGNNDTNILHFYLKFYSQGEKVFFLNYILKHKLKKFKSLRVQHEYKQNFEKLLPVLKKNKSWKLIGIDNFDIVKLLIELLNQNIGIQRFEVPLGIRNDMLSNPKINCSINLYLQNIFNFVEELKTNNTETSDDLIIQKKMFYKILNYLKKFLQINYIKAFHSNWSLKSAISFLNYEAFNEKVFIDKQTNDKFDIPIDNENRYDSRNNQNAYDDDNKIKTNHYKNNLNVSNNTQDLIYDSIYNWDVYIEKEELEVLFTFFFLMMERCHIYDRGPSFYHNELKFFPNMIIAKQKICTKPTTIKFNYCVKLGEMDLNAYFTSGNLMDVEYFKKIFEKIDAIELQNSTLLLNLENKIDLDLPIMLKKIKRIEYMDTLNVNNFSLLEGNSDLNSFSEIEQKKNFNSRLKRITLSNNRLTDKGFGLLMKLIPFTSIISVLNITHNYLENINSEFLCSKLDSNLKLNHLRTLNLANNKLNDYAVNLIFTKFEMPFIEEIDLSYNKILFETDFFKGEKIEKEHVNNENDLVSLNKQLSSEINQCSNSIKTAEKFNKQLSLEFHYLLNLNLKNNSIGDYGLFNFFSSFKTEKLKTIDLSFNKIQFALDSKNKKFHNFKIKQFNIANNPISELAFLNLIKNNFIKNSKQCLIDESDFKYIKIKKFKTGEILFRIFNYNEFFSKYKLKFENLFDSNKNLIKFSREGDTKDSKAYLEVSVLHPEKAINDLLDLRNERLNDESLIEFFDSLIPHEIKSNFGINQKKEQNLHEKCGNDTFYFKNQLDYSQIFGKLDYLDLSFNKLSKKSIHLIMGDFQIPNLKVLNLNNAFYSNEEEIEFDVNKVFESVFPLLENLNICNNKFAIEFDDLRFFLNKKQKMKLQITQNQMNYVVQKPIKKLNFENHFYNCKEIFPFFTNLKKFLFENKDNFYYMKGEKQIKSGENLINLNEICKNFYDLNEINLVNQKINDQLVYFILKYFNLENLKILNLDRNDITMDSEFLVEKVLKSDLAYLPKLVHLSLNNNRISNTGFVNLFMKINSPILVTLKLRNNEITNNKNNFMNQINKDNVNRNFESLMVLDVSENFLDDSYREYFADILKKVKKIKI